LFPFQTNLVGLTSSIVNFAILEQLALGTTFILFYFFNARLFLVGGGGKVKHFLFNYVFVSYDVRNILWSKAS
jgi:hypothetical protein